MPLITHRCLTTWVGDGQSMETAFRSRLSADHPLENDGEKIEDVSPPPHGKPPEGAQTAVVMATYEASRWAAIEADDNVTVLPGGGP